MGAMTTDEYMAATRRGEGFHDGETITSWAVAAASTIMLMSVNGEGFSKDELLEAVQSLGLRIPLDLLIVSSMNIEDAKKEFYA